MAIPYYHVDSFASELFAGNPAGVCILSTPLADNIMQKIAAENRHSETAFIVPRADGDFDLRWFTPEVEDDLCGHATLASAYVLSLRKQNVWPVRFHTRWNDTNLNLLKNVHASDFEVVQTGTIYTPGNVPTGASPTISSFTANPNVDFCWSTSYLELDGFQRRIQHCQSTGRPGPRNSSRGGSDCNHHLHTLFNQPIRTNHCDRNRDCPLGRTTSQK